MSIKIDWNEEYKWQELPDTPYWGLTEEEFAELSDEETKKKRWYHRYPIEQIKPGGRVKVRMIEAPAPKLKAVQQRILHEVIYASAGPSEYAHGFVVRRSPETAAQVHLGQELILCMDIKDFFPSINRQHLLLAIFKWCNAKDNVLKNRMDDVFTLCLYDGRLPQGAPTSPALANLAVRQLDNQLEAAARHFSPKGAKKGDPFAVKYTRYADDLVFSASDPCFECAHNAHRMMHGRISDCQKRKVCQGCNMRGRRLNRHIPFFIQIIEAPLEGNEGWGFKVHNSRQKAIKVMRPGRRQSVNGLVVNRGLDSPRMSRFYRDRTRVMIHDYLMSVVFGRKPRTPLHVIEGRVAKIQGAFRPHGEKLKPKLELIRQCRRDERKRVEVREFYLNRQALGEIDRIAA